MSINNWPGGVINKTPVTPAGPYADGPASGVWTLEQATNYIKQGIWPLAGNYPTDPYFEYVTMLLHGDGTNGGQNNTFLDSSANNYTITRNGNTTQGSFSPYGSLWSNYFDGAGDYLSIADNAALDISGDFTIEFWANVDSGNVDRAGIIGHRDQSTFTDGTDWVIRVETSAGKIGFGYDSSGNYYDMGSYVVGEWAHYAITRSGTTIRTFKNGTQVATATSSSTWSSTAAFLIGRNVSGFDYKGFLSNVRLVKGTAVYTSAFTPSTAPLTAITNTSLLTCQSNRFIDNSTNNFTITRNGNTSVTNFAPFNPTAAYSTATNGGSGYFDGSGDYLTVADAAALDVDAGDFTVEAWIYVTGDITAVQPVLAKGFGSAGGWMLWVQNTLRLRMYDGAGASVTATSSATLVSNSWNHVAGTRSGNTLTVWVNGVSSGTATFTGTSTNSSSLEVGGYNAATALITGYISSARLVKGTAVYTGNFTPPSSPLTAVSGTSLLLGFTNGAIFDNSMKNDLETVGNAQISTSVKKYGTGSLAFDGSGDWLQMPNSQDFNFGSGNFTVECWVYCTNTSPRQDIFTTPANGSGFNGLSIQIYNGNFELTSCWSSGSWQILFAAAGAVSTNTWYHLAVVRNGGTLTVYVNGASTYSNTGLSTNSLVFGTDPATISYGRINQSDARYFYGNIDDFRITKGVARYTANFTPPTAAFPNQ